MHPHINSTDTTRSCRKHMINTVMPRQTALLLLLVLNVLLQFSSGEVSGARDETKHKLPVQEMDTRKLLREVTLDYDYGGPNPRHDPKKGKPGIGGRSSP